MARQRPKNIPEQPHQAARLPVVDRYEATDRSRCGRPLVSTSAVQATRDFSHFAQLSPHARAYLARVLSEMPSDAAADARAAFAASHWPAPTSSGHRAFQSHTRPTDAVALHGATPRGVDVVADGDKESEADKQLRVEAVATPTRDIPEQPQQQVRAAQNCMWRGVPGGYMLQQHVVLWTVAACKAKVHACVLCRRARSPHV